MKRILFSLLTLITINVYAQQKGISYQAVILNPKSLTTPGFDVANSPLASKKVCMLFEVVDGASQVEYQETVQTSTDQFGMVNLMIGNGTKTGGYAANFSRIGWVAGNKKLVVSINVTGTCANYTKISDQPIMYTPYALFAENANLSDGYITTVKIADGAVTDAKVATGISPVKVGLGNVNNTSDANKPVSTAAQTALDAKENSINKSTAISLGTSDVLFPTQNAVKTYVDSKVLTGPQGLTGVKGDKGDIGQTGLTGAASTVAGPTGAAGPAGSQGPIGPIGLTGAAGAASTVAGPRGLQGETGPAGTLGTVPVANGGTGVTTLTANNVLLGNGPGAVQVVAPGANGNILTSNGTTWTSTAINGSFVNLTTAQTINGVKTFGNNVIVNGITIGTGGGNNQSNTAIGQGALRSNTTGSGNTANGVNALASNTERNNNTANGNNALRSNVLGRENTASGAESLVNNTSGTYNAAFGVQSLEQNTEGNFNTAIGVAAIDRNQSGSNNAVLGAFAGRLIANGNFNELINNSVLIGNNTRPLANNADNEIVIGSSAVGKGSNTIQLGNTNVLSVNTSGALTTGTVTYPRAHNSTAGQVLTVDGSGTATWANAGGGGTSNVREEANQFSATAAQASFTLLQTPSVNSKVKMYINGVRISNSAYTLSGTTVTYLPANNGAYTITADDRIQFDYFY